MTTEELLANTFEPRRAFRFIVEHPLIPQFLMKGLKLTRGGFNLQFYDTEKHKIFEKLLDSLDKCEDYEATIKGLTGKGEVFARFKFHDVRLMNIGPTEMDYGDDNPVYFIAEFCYRSRDEEIG